MKEKNKKLIIIVACLLAVIGVSLAYFTSTLLTGGTGSDVDATAATIKGSELIVEGSLSFNDLDVLPGHKNVSSIKLTATGDNTLIPYNVIWEGTNTLNTPLNYTIYKTTSEIDVSASCEKVVGNMGASKIYYEECSISNEDALGSIIATGTIENGNTKVTLIPDEFITSSPSGEVVYYYVILEYPNLDESQNIDIGGTFSGEITIEENKVTSDLTIAGIYIENNGTYEQSNSIPSEGYTLNTEESTCNNNASIGWDSEEEEIYVSNLNTTNTECTLYFDEYNPNAAKDYILSHYDTVLTRNDFSVTVTNTTTGTIYYEDTSKGRTYYFAGNPTDNWVKFGGFYWRIIRINEDGTLRLIYQGTEANITGTNTQIGTSQFNAKYTDNTYVGYMYGTSGSSTYEATHVNMNDSAIKEVLDEWYQNNLIRYADKIDGNAGFCGDRSSYYRNGVSGSYTYTSGGGTKTEETYYGAYTKLYTGNEAGINPTFECDNDRDLYTTSESGQGSKALIEPIGLVSANEVAYAGGVWGKENQSYYLYTNNHYWTMSPSYFSSDGSSYVFCVAKSGYLGNWNLTNAFGVRPVINLKADIQLSGSGTSTDPYTVVEN